MRFIHFQLGGSKRIEETVDLMLQHPLHRREGLPVLQVNHPYANRSEVPSRGVDLWIHRSGRHGMFQTEGQPV
jgi:hypothetical protein